MKVDIPSPEYERKCLEAVRRTLLGDGGRLSDLVKVQWVGLVREDDRPLIVAHLTRRGEKVEEVWRLYEDVFSGVPPPGHAEDPQGVADQMLVWALGG
jgi:hypothetical protein